MAKEKEKEFGGSGSGSARRSLKSNNYETWKQKLRENCYKRVREDRTRLLWKMRLPSNHSHSQSQDIVNSAFQDIVSDELIKVKHSINIPLSDDDLLWDYDGLHTTYQAECEDILLEMQRIFYEDLDSVKGLEIGTDTWDDEVDEYLACAVYEHMQLNEDKARREETWCPICKKGELKEDYNLIYCTHCELQLNKANELTLDFLRDRLAEAHSEHLDRGCRLKPRFCMKTKFNLTALYISCEGCDTFEVVI